MNTKKLETTPSDELLNLYANIARLITSSLEINKVIESIMEQVYRYFQPDNWSLLRLDSSTNELYFVVAKGIDSDEIKDVRLKMGEGIAGVVAQTGRLKWVKNVMSHPNFSPKVDNLSGFKTQSVIAVPIIFRKKVLGVIELINTPYFTNKSLQTLQTIADFAAIALTNSIRYDRIKTLAASDTLTGLYNRSRLKNLIKSYKKIPKAPNKRRTSDASYIIVIGIDVDNFKDVNDTLGHDAGDNLLIHLSKLLRTYCREEDLAFRIGGDEFLIVIQNINKTDLSALMARFEEKLLHDSQEEIAKFKFSFGIAGGLKENITDLIINADKKMYKSKLSKKK